MFKKIANDEIDSIKKRQTELNKEIEELDKNNKKKEDLCG